MVEMKIGGSVSRVAFEAALGELEKQVAGRIADDQVEQLFGPRLAHLREMGILSEALVSAYAEKAAEEEGAGLVDEAEQARRILARYDERLTTGRRKRRTARVGRSKEQGGDDNRDVAGSVIVSGISSSREIDAGDTKIALDQAEGDKQWVIEGDDRSPDEPDDGGWPR